VAVTLNVTWVPSAAVWLPGCTVITGFVAAQHAHTITNAHKIRFNMYRHIGRNGPRGGRYSPEATAAVCPRLLPQALRRNELLLPEFGFRSQL
jgi:hypothetical protein